VNAYPAEVTLIIPADRTHPSEQGTFSSLVAGAARSCASFVRGPFDIGPCVGAQFSSMNATGTKKDNASASGVGEVMVQNGDGSGQWWSIVAGAASSWSLTPSFALFLRGDIMFALDQPHFGFSKGPRDLSDLADVYRVPVVAGRGVLGLEVRFF
jgi:hypothetical protein